MCSLGFQQNGALKFSTNVLKHVTVIKSYLGHKFLRRNELMEQTADMLNRHVHHRDRERVQSLSTGQNQDLFVLISLTITGLIDSGW